MEVLFQPEPRALASSNLIDFSFFRLSVLAGFVQMNPLLTLRRSQNIDNIIAMPSQVENTEILRGYAFDPTVADQVPQVVITTCCRHPRQSNLPQQNQFVIEWR